jgi:hypothetical protein
MLSLMRNKKLKVAQESRHGYQQRNPPLAVSIMPNHSQRPSSQMLTLYQGMY